MKKDEHMLDDRDYASHNALEQLFAEALGLTTLAGCVETSSNDAQLIDSDEAVSERRGSAPDTAMDLLRHNLRRYTLLTATEEAELSNSMAHSCQQIARALLKHPTTAEDLVKVVSLLLQEPVTVQAVGSLRNYHLLKRELSDLIKTPAKADILRSRAQQMLSQTLAQPPQNAPQNLPQKIEAWACFTPLTAHDQPEPMPTLATIDWSWPLLIAIAQRSLGPPANALARALNAFVAHYHGPLPPAIQVRDKENNGVLRQLIAEYTQQRNTLVLRNMPLVFSIAQKHYSQAIDFSELVQEGTLGLMRAAEKYRHNTGNRFSTYAYNWIDAKIRAAKTKLGSVVPLSPEVSNEIAQLIQATTVLKQAGKPPTPQHLARMLKMKEPRVRTLMRLKRGFVSLDQPEEDNERDRHSYYPDPSTNTVDNVAQDHLRKRLLQMLNDNLSSREYYILCERYGLLDHDPKTLGRLGEILQVSGESIRQAELRALRKLKRLFKGTPDAADFLACLRSF